MTFKMTWHGDEILKKIREETPEALFEGAEMLAQEAANNAPKNTGTLRESAYVTNGERSTYKKRKRYLKQVKVKKGETAVAFAAYYARFIEYGTKNQPARPFLRPAVDQLKGRIGDKIAIRIGRKFK